MPKEYFEINRVINENIKQIEKEIINPFKYPFDFSREDVLNPRTKNNSKITI